MNVFIGYGAMGSGKTTFVNFLKKKTQLEEFNQYIVEDLPLLIPGDNFLCSPKYISRSVMSAKAYVPFLKELLKGIIEDVGFYHIKHYPSSELLTEYFKDCNPPTRFQFELQLLWTKKIEDFMTHFTDICLNNREIIFDTNPLCDILYIFWYYINGSMLIQHMFYLIRQAFYNYYTLICFLNEKNFKRAFKLRGREFEITVHNYLFLKDYNTLSSNCSHRASTRDMWKDTHKFNSLLEFLSETACILKKYVYKTPSPYFHDSDGSIDFKKETVCHFIHSNQTKLERP